MPREAEDAVILCGGAGTRLQGVLADRPKSMAIVHGRPFLEWLVLALSRLGVRRVVLATGHMADQVHSYFQGGRFGVEIAFSREAEPLGTGGALRLAADRITSAEVLVLNGDSYCRFDLQRMRERHQRAGAAATLWLVNIDDPGRFGSVDVTADGEITGFNEKRSGKSGPINAGVYLMRRTVIDSIPAGTPVSLERDTFPALAGHGLYGVVGSGVFVDIGTPESLHDAERALAPELDRLEVAR